MGKREENDAPASEGERQSVEGERSGTLKGGHDARELAARSVASRREKAARREQEAEEGARTFRQRLGVSLSKLTQEELDAAVRAMAKDAAAGKSQAMGALARAADQAFGKPQPEEDEDGGGDDDLSRLSRAQRSAMIARLMEEERMQRQAAGDEADPRGTPPPPGPPAPP